MDEIKRLQDNFALIRRCVGWTNEEFGDKLGVSKMTISNIETKRHPLTKIQYIAIRSILDAEIVSNKDDTEMLVVLLDMLVDNPNRYNAREKEELLLKANLISPSILAKTATRNEVSKEWVKTATKICGVTIMAVLSNPILIETVGIWLIKILSSKRKG